MARRKQGDTAFWGTLDLLPPHRTSLAVQEGSGHLDTAGHLKILK